MPSLPLRVAVQLRTDAFKAFGIILASRADVNIETGDDGWK